MAQKKVKQYICIGCGAKREGRIQPRGWHRDSANNRFCPECWHACYLLRAITIPLAGPVDGTWKELREALKTCWRASTRLSNWAVTELAKADIVRTPDMETLPKRSAIYLYPGARSLVPEMDTGSVVAVLHAVEGRWGRTRYDVLWLGKASLPNYRYPTPYPVRSQDWKAIKGDNGQALVSVRLAGKRWLLRLRGGEQFCRQLNSHTQLVDGRAVLAELSIYEQRANEADHRLGTNGRDSGGQRINSRVMVKMVGWFPRPPRPAVQEGVLFVMPSEEAMLVAVDAKANRLWTYHGDHIRRWVAEHARRRQSWSDDQKPEARQRGGPGKAASRRDAACLKQRRRLASAVKEIAAMVVSYAARRRFAEVRWVLADSHYLSSFPWAALRGRIQTKCNEVNIEYKETKHGDDATERPGV